LSEQTGVSIAELETFLTPTATGVGLDDLTVSGTAATGTMGPLVETPQQIAYKKAMKVFDDAGGGEAGKAAVLKALEDNNLSLQDLATQTGVSLDEIKTFLGLGGLTIDGGTPTSTVGPVLPDSATGILGLDTTGPNLTKRVDYSPLDLKKGIGALDQQTDLKRSVTREAGPNTSGTLEHVPGASTTYRSSLGEAFPGAAATFKTSLNEGAPGDLKGALRGLEGTLTAGEVFKGEFNEPYETGSSSVQKASTLRGSSGGGGGGMDTGGGSPGQVAGGPGDLAEIEYLFQRFGDTIFAPELTKEEENELLYPYS